MGHWNSSFVKKKKHNKISNNQITTLKINTKSLVMNALTKTENTFAIICQKGKLNCDVNAKEYTALAPFLMIILPQTFVEIKSISDELEGTIISMNEEFTENLEIENRLLPILSLLNNCLFPLQKSELKSLLEYCATVKKLNLNTNNPYALKSIKYLTKAYFYGLGHDFFTKYMEEANVGNQMWTNKFLTEVQKSYLQHRNVNYYAEKLHLTPKYFSKIIKETTGFSAKVWINRFVIMEAKSLLKHPHLTIQQIAEKLNFPSPSFFGKYFKRNVGVSPLDYRKNCITD